MKHIIPLLAAAALLLLPSCRFVRFSDEVKEQIRNNGVTWMGEESGETIDASEILATRAEEPGDFSALDCNLPCDVTYTPGDCAITFSGPDNVLPHILVLNDNGRLTIKSDGAGFRKLKHLRINVSSPVLESVVFNGAVDFEAPDGITGTDFTAAVNGAGDLEINGLKARTTSITVNGAGDAEISGIDCERLTVQINGAGDATVSGNAASADLMISGAGSIDATALNCINISSRVRGIGRIRRD